MVMLDLIIIYIYTYSCLFIILYNTLLTAYSLASFTSLSCTYLFACTVIYCIFYLLQIFSCWGLEQLTCLRKQLLIVCSTYLLLYYSPACRSYLFDCSSFLHVFVYSPACSYLPACTAYCHLLSVAFLGVWYSPLPVPVYCFPARLWSFAAIALSLSFVLSHLSCGGRLVESHSVARVAWRRTTVVSSACCCCSTSLGTVGHL